MRHYDFTDAAVVLSGSSAAREFFEPIFSGRDRELTIVGFCDRQLRLIQLLSFPGTEDSCDVSLKEIATHAVGSAGFIMAHNHPSGSADPSEADKHLTRRLCVLAEALDVDFLDHLIFADAKMTSFRRAGLI